MHKRRKLKNQLDPAAVDKGTVVNYLDTPKGIRKILLTLVAHCKGGAGAAGS